MRPLHFTTVTGTAVLTPINGGQPVGLLGGCASSVESTTIYLKLWWQHDNAAIPVIGTTPPDVTIQIPTTGLVPFTFNYSLQGGGACWYSATLLAADSDTTSVGAGGDVITLFLA